MGFLVFPLRTYGIYFVCKIAIVPWVEDWYRDRPTKSPHPETMISNRKHADHKMTFYPHLQLMRMSYHSVRVTRKCQKVFGLTFSRSRIFGHFRPNFVLHRPITAVRLINQLNLIPRLHAVNPVARTTGAVAVDGFHGRLISDEATFCPL